MVNNRSEFVKFDPNYCSSNITLESETRARCNNQISSWSSVLGTKSNSFKVILISKCTYLMIGFAPKSINVNDSDHSKHGYYLRCYNGRLRSKNGDSTENYLKTDSTIKDGSIVECSFEKENGTISYKVNGISYGVAYSNVPNNHDGGGDGNGELFPALSIFGEDCIFELLRERQ